MLVVSGCSVLREEGAGVARSLYAACQQAVRDGRRGENHEPSSTVQLVWWRTTLAQPCHLGWGTRASPSPSAMMIAAPARGEQRGDRSFTKKLAEVPAAGPAPNCLVLCCFEGWLLTHET